MTAGRVDGSDGRTRTGLREIAARDVENECLKTASGGKRYVLTGAKIVGALQLAEAALDRELWFVGCEFTDVIDLRGARAASGIHWKGCELRSVLADRLHVGGDLLFETVRVAAEVSFRGALVRGDLRCTGSSFLRSGEKAFDAKGVVVGGSVLFEDGCALLGELVLETARVEGTVDLTGATLSGATGRAVTANGIRTGAELLMTGLRATGEVCLDGGIITGKVSCTGGVFTNRGGTALRAEGISCRSMWLNDGFVADGMVDLVGATVTVELNCSHGTVENGVGRDALKMDGLVAGKVFLDDGFRAIGEVSLCNARIATELNCTKGTFHNGGHIGVKAGGLRCDGNVYLNEGFAARGTVGFQDAAVKCDLNCKNGSFDTLDAQRLTVGGTFDWQPHETPGKADVSFATLGLLRDRPPSWPPDTRLAGLTVKSFDGGNMSAEERITWLEKAGEYAPEVYHQLVRFYRQCGKVDDSYSVAIANQRRRRKDGGLPRSARLWSWFLDWSVGYGYRMHRPLIALLIAGAAGTVMFWLAQTGNLMIPVAAGPGSTIDANTCVANYPCFAPWTYSYELVLPVVNLRQVNYWLPDATSGWGKLLFAYVWVAVVAGWLACVGIVAGIGQLINQRD
ncbi:hypothetical protein QRX60_30160 [Amycolatopsis mongoliensis]|uniref:Membrane-associated oxidoreductase n=1 Tax=Amycolatopsis mongoliensis TaxID=715475 RepID=A0A9Y2NBB8_9PSEU|nr:hypothetical protein [Amycolatopsis sp. 4-36]WIX98321.1 hypothetical protein QRX60_30160 [Amycolatopsis sp. 4-36]